MFIFHFVFMHHPIGSFPLSFMPNMKNQCLDGCNGSVIVLNRSVFPSSFPEPTFSRAIRSTAA
ncbi:hypothetical protein HanIR_Chr07g0307171 [Helianthus annuus]|nr:hypothetical protein HanIR_Chr07g0307171 [Helianthus annuus]